MANNSKSLHSPSPPSSPDSNQSLIIILTLGIAILAFAHFDQVSSSTSVDDLPPLAPTELSLSWLNEYRLDLDIEGIEPEYLATTSYYDTQSDLIQHISGSILSTSGSPKEAVENTLKYVYNQVEYIVGESDAACLQATGSSVIKSGQGQCDTQSIAIITLLRSMGIASKPVGGCIYRVPCGIQAIFIPIEPQIGYVDIDTLSRGGGLHAWVEVWLPDDGWVTIEPTTGRFADLNCYGYMVEMYPENNDKYHICLAESRDFALQCREL